MGWALPSGCAPLRADGEVPVVIKREIYLTPERENRLLHIYLPEDWEESGQRYPVMYFFDGHNLFSDGDATYGTCWGLKDFLDRWGRALICVGVECGHRDRQRLREYCPYHFNDSYFGDLRGTGQATLDWMVNELKPWIDRAYPTYAFRQATGIGGSSMGGLMSLYAVIRYNHTFSKAACLSSTVTPCVEELLRDLRVTRMDLDTRVYLSWGEQEGAGSAEKLNGNFDTYTAQCNFMLAEGLKRKGAATLLYRQPHGRHCEADWGKQNPLYMDFLWNQ